MPKSPESAASTSSEASASQEDAAAHDAAAHGATDEDSHPSGELWLLWNEHLRYLSSIGIVFTGGILTLIQTTALEVGPDSLIPMGLFLGGTLASLFAQSSIVDAATNRKNKVPKAAKILRVASFSLLGGGVGYFLKSVFDHFT